MLWSQNTVSLHDVIQYSQSSLFNTHPRRIVRLDDQSSRSVISYARCLKRIALGTLNFKNVLLSYQTDVISSPVPADKYELIPIWDGVHCFTEIYGSISVFIR